MKVSNPYLRQQTATWFCRVDGRVVQLGPKGSSEAEARAAWSLLKAQEEFANGEAREHAKSLTVAAMVGLYSSETAHKKRPSTIKNRQRLLEHFIAAFGERCVSEVKTSEIEAWLNTFTGLNDGGRLQYIRTVNACFNFLVKRGFIAKNPVQQIDRPPSRVRGEWFALTEPDHLTLLKSAKPWHAQLMLLLHETGARPSEILELQADEVYLDKRIIRKKHHKNIRHGKERVIVLSALAMEIVSAALKARPSGYLFVTRRGTPMPETTFGEYVRILRKKLHLAAPISPYSWRHGAAARWLTGGMSMYNVAKLLGNTVGVCERHYAHVCAFVADIHGLLEKANKAS